jgi:hypothetical protein
MKFQVNRLFVIAAIGLFSVAASALPAAAQVVYKGQFTLPHEVRWQNAKLPAGNYTFSLPSLVSFSRMTITGPNGSVFEVAHVNPDHRSEGPSVLILEQRDGTYFVREMDLSEVAVQICYNVPKQSRSDEQLAQAPATTEKILVAMVNKK